jgi:transcriptional regulator with XRE-family HTH domain
LGFYKTTRNRRLVKKIGVREENKLLYEKIKDLRKKNNWSQQKLAEKAKLSYNAITKIEQGTATHPTIQTIAKIAKAFNVSIDELLEREKEK